MKITIEPTEEIHTQFVNGVELPFRVWIGKTDQSTPVIAFMFTIMSPAHDAELTKQLPEYMIRARDAFDIKPDGSR